MSRFFLAFSAFFRILFDGAFAERVAFARTAPEALPPPAPVEPPKPPPPPMRENNSDAALQLLAILQREGRFIDFLEEDMSAFGDADIGAAARVVHTGCKKALREHVKIANVRSENEEARVTLPVGFDASAVRVTGNVVGSPPFTGTLRHRGWRATSVVLPQLTSGHDATILAPAEVEL